jgi:acyl-coenzyme A thioesterase PaaI-like protein
MAEVMSWRVGLLPGETKDCAHSHVRNDVGEGTIELTIEFRNTITCEDVRMMREGQPLRLTVREALQRE